MMMKCPACGEAAAAVIDSRGLADSTEVRRRRECRECKYRFSTYERMPKVRPEVVTPPQPADVPTCSRCDNELGGWFPDDCSTCGYDNSKTMEAD